MAVPGRDSDESLAPDPPGLEVRNILGNPKRARKTYMVGEGMAPLRDVYAFNSTIVNLLKAVKERVFYVKDDNGKFVPPPRPGVNPFKVAGLREEKLFRDDECGICLSGYPRGSSYIELDCHHKFHGDCIREWVGHNLSCQMCRTEVKQTSIDVDHSVDVYTQRLGAIQRRILKQCPRLCPLEREEFPLLYVGKKRTVYENAVQSLYSRSIERKDGYTKNFTKTERTLKFKAVPRNISPRDPRYNVEVGLVLKPAEAILLDAITKVLGSKTVMKGMNAAQIGSEFKRKWEVFGGDGHAVAIGLDASRFDQHVSRMALEWEHKFYLGLISDRAVRRRLARLLGWQIKNTGYGRCSDGSLKYEIEGTRCSGDMNTGLGNCLIASCLLIVYCEQRSIPFELANNGDDCVIFCDKKYFNKFSHGLSHWFVEMGFDMVVEEPVYELEKVVFCQSQPVFDGSSWTMVRDPRTCIAKDCVSLKPWHNQKEYESWIKCVGLSGTSLAGGIPVLDSFYRAFVRAGRATKPLALTDPTLQGGLFWQSKGMHRRDLIVTSDARYSFWRAFDITPDEQVTIEAEYNSSTPFYKPVREDWESLPVHEHGLLL